MVTLRPRWDGYDLEPMQPAGVLSADSNALRVVARVLARNPSDTGIYLPEVVLRGVEALGGATLAVTASLSTCSAKGFTYVGYFILLTLQNRDGSFVTAGPGIHCHVAMAPKQPQLTGRSARPRLQPVFRAAADSFCLRCAETGVGGSRIGPCVSTLPDACHT